MEKAKREEDRAPRCDLRWEDDHFVLDCETPEDQERATRALKEAEVVVKEQAAPKCDLRWEDDHFVLDCETPEDQDRAAKALEQGEVVVRVKSKKQD